MVASVLTSSQKLCRSSVTSCLLFVVATTRNLSRKVFEESKTDDLSIKIRHIVSAVLQAGSIYRLAEARDLKQACSFCDTYHGQLCASGQP